METFDLDRARKEFGETRKNITAVHGEHFFYYNAEVIGLVIDAGKPWQLLTNSGCVIAKYETEEKARTALEHLEDDWDILPCNLNDWDKASLLK